MDNNTIKIPISDGLYLVVEASTDPEYPCEVYAGIATAGGAWIQNLAYICREYKYTDEDTEFKNSFCIKAFSNAAKEDPDYELKGIKITDYSVLKDFLESEEWELESGVGGPRPERIDSEFILHVIRARYHVGSLAEESLEMSLNYLFANDAKGLADYLIPEEIRNDYVVSYCIEHAGEYLADLPEFEEELPFH